MVFFGVLGFILLFLFNPASVIAEIDETALSGIINHLHNTYGGYNQYALGIKVPSRYCRPGTAPDNNFLPDDNNAQRVRNDMAGAERVYKGTRLIGARPKPIPNQALSYHSEYLLLIRSMSPRFAQSDPLMQTLLNANTFGCAVFFTLNSPCVNRCSRPGGRYSIIPHLRMFQNLNKKAFVFRNVWRDNPTDDQWNRNILAINAHIPVYRCVAGGCTRCVENNHVNPTCL